MIRGDEIHSGNDTGVGSTATGIEHANGDERNVLRYAPCRTTNRTRHVRAVTITVPRAQPVVDCRETGNHATTEVNVRGPDSGIDDISSDSSAGRVEVVS